MARITAQARKLATLTRARSQRRDFLDDLLDDDDDLEGIGDLLSGIPIIGGLLGGLGGGGGAADKGAAAAPAAPAVDPGVMAAAMASKGGGGGGGATEVAVHHASEIGKRPTRTDLRNIVKDAIAAHAATTNAEALQAATHARLADEHAEKITRALSPRAAATHGGIQEQRLQAQATAEHNAIMRRERLQRETHDEHARILAKLEKLVAQVSAVQRALGGAEIVRGKAINILGGRDAIERHR